MTGVYKKNPKRQKPGVFPEVPETGWPASMVLAGTLDFIEQFQKRR
jgi:hypothetical protein